VAEGPGTPRGQGASGGNPRTSRGTKSTSGTAGRGQTESRGVSQGGRTGASQDRRSGTGQDRRAGVGQDRRGGAPHNRRTGAAEDRRAGAAQNRRPSSAQDRRSGAADRGSRRADPGPAADSRRETTSRRSGSSPSGSRPFSRAPRGAADGGSREDGWAPGERRGPAARPGDQSRRTSGPRSGGAGGGFRSSGRASADGESRGSARTPSGYRPGRPDAGESRVAKPGPGAVRAGPPIVMVYVAGDLPLLVTAKPGLAAEPAVLARLGRRVPPTVATGAQVLRGHARTARAGTTPTVARRGRVGSDPVPPARRIGRSAIEVTPLGGRHVTARQDPRATRAATSPHGGPAAATAIVAATAPGAATAVGAASAAGAPVVSAQAADTPGAVIAPVAASALGPGGTKLRPGRPARGGRSFRTRSLPTNSIARHGPS